MFKNFSLVCFIALALSACGNGNNDQTVANGYGYNQNGFGNGRMCPQPVVNDWVGLVASNCEGVRDWNDAGAQNCAFGTREFADRYPGIDCDIAVAEARWCPNDGSGNWRRQKTVKINDAVIQDIFNHVGPAGTPTFPVGRGGPGGPGRPGRPGFPGHH